MLLWVFFYMNLKWILTDKARDSNIMALGLWTMDLKKEHYFQKQYNIQKIQSLIWGEASFNNVQENLKMCQLCARKREITDSDIWWYIYLHIYIIHNDGATHTKVYTILILILSWICPVTAYLFTHPTSLFLFNLCEPNELDFCCRKWSGYQFLNCNERQAVELDRTRSRCSYWLCAAISGKGSSYTGVRCHPIQALTPPLFLIY